ELEGTEEHLRSLESQVRSIQEGLDISNHELENLSATKESKNKDRSLADMELIQLDKDFQREDKLVGLVTMEIAQVQNEMESVFARSEQSSVQLADQTNRRLELEQQFGGTEQQLATAREQQQSLQGRL